METETVKTEMPKEIHALEYAGFWDFNTDGFYGPSLLNIEDNKDAEQVANEIARRYNSHYELLEALKAVVRLKNILVADDDYYQDVEHHAEGEAVYKLFHQIESAISKATS